MFRTILLSLFTLFSNPTSQIPITPVAPVPTVTLSAPSDALPSQLISGTISYLPWDQDSSIPATAPASLYQSDELSGNFSLSVSDMATSSGQGDIQLTSLLPQRILFFQKSGTFIYQTTQVISIKFASNLVELATGSAQISQTSTYPTIKIISGSAKFAQVGSDDLPHLYYLTSHQIAYFTPWGIYIY